MKFYLLFLILFSFNAKAIEIFEPAQTYSCSITGSKNGTVLFSMNREEGIANLDIHLGKIHLIKELAFEAAEEWQKDREILVKVKAPGLTESKTVTTMEFTLILEKTLVHPILPARETKGELIFRVYNGPAADETAYIVYFQPYKLQCIATYRY